MVLEDYPQCPAEVKGYDFLVNSVWPQLVALLEVKVAVIFTQGNPEVFHKVKCFSELCVCLCVNVFFLFVFWGKILTLKK